MSTETSGHADTKVVLLSLDFEFTHPSPRVGVPMSVGMCAMPCTWPDENGMFAHRNMTEEWHTKFWVPKAGVHVTPWVQKNQGDLLKECQALEPDYQYPLDAILPRDQFLLGNRQRIESLKGFLRHLNERYNCRIVPVGWVMGSDIAYLLDLLGADCDLVHYSARDLSGLLTALTGTLDPPPEGASSWLRVPANDKPHDALSDARHQLAMFLSAVYESQSARASTASGSGPVY